VTEHISEEQAIDAVNLLSEYCFQLRDSVGIFRDDNGSPMVFVTQCEHCAKLFDQFAQLDDDGKQKALSAVREESANAARVPGARQKETASQ
jgi:hypothetical protein